MKPVRKEKKYMDGYFDVKIDMLNAASEEGVPPEMLWAISATESAFRPDAIGYLTDDEGKYIRDRKGNKIVVGKGIAQMTPIACEEIGVDYKTVDKDAYTNLKASAKLLSKYREYVDKNFPNLKTEEDKWRMTALYYNAGPDGAYNYIGEILGDDIPQKSLRTFDTIYDRLHGKEIEIHKKDFVKNYRYAKKYPYILDEKYIRYQQWLRERRQKRRKKKK